MRNRSKTIIWYGTHNHLPSGTVIFANKSYPAAVYETMSDHPKAPGPLRVHKTVPVSFIQIDPSETYDFIYYNVPMLTPFYGAVVENRLNWKKLPTSNQFDILTTLAEFDDAIAMFGKKFISSLSYGGYKWGWTPLLNDISAVNDAATAVKNSVLDGNRRSSPYNSTDSYTSKPVPFLNGGYEITQIADIKVKFTGSISYENDVCAFYDYMGFHPSPKLFWDLVPMSFAIDYVLPIGDMISNITPTKGWVKHANFTGWRVTTINCETTRKPIEGHGLSTRSSTVISTDKIVVRDYCNGTALAQKDLSKSIGLKLPTISQAFDIAYLANTLAKGNSKGRR